MTKRFGFTLAEVLITLGIIGVVAAMTMPTLINQTNGAQFRAAFKKELSVMAQAAALNQALDDWDFSGISTTATLQSLVESRINTISIGDDAPADYSPTVADADNYVKVKDASGTETAISYAAPSSPIYAIFNDGSMFVFDEPGEDGCTQADPCFGYFDVNGPKNPNKVTTCDGGTEDTCYVKDNIADIFPVYFYGQTILPATYAGNAVLADKTKATSGS